MNKLLKIVPFKIEHINMIDVREYEANTEFKIIQADKGIAEEIELNQNAFTIFYKGIILACWGYTLMRKGVCEIWTIPSKHIKKYGRVYAKTTREQFLRFEKIYNFHRIQITTKADKCHERWLKFLGFHKEGIMKKYAGNGDDFIMWGRTS